QDTVRRGGVRGHAPESPVATGLGVQPQDRGMVELPFLRWTAAAKGVREPDTSFAVNRQVIGPVVAASLESVGQRRHVAVRLKTSDAILPRLAPIEAPLRIEHQTVGRMRPGTELHTC